MFISSKEKGFPTRDIIEEDNEIKIKHQSTNNEMTFATTAIKVPEGKEIRLLRNETETKPTNVVHLEQGRQEEIQRQKQKMNQHKPLIFVKIGKTEHPAFELLPDDAPAAMSKDSDSIWVKWASNGKKECVFKHQIVKGGLSARKHRRPDYFHDQNSRKSTKKCSS